MGRILGENFDAGDSVPYISDQIGIFLGIKHEGIALTGTADGTNKNFVFPTASVPYMDNDLNAAIDGIIDKNDVIVYVNGVAATLTSFTPGTRTAVIATAPANAATVTADFIELVEVLPLEDHKHGAKGKELKYGMYRNTQEKSIQTGVDVTLDLNLKVDGPGILEYYFDSSTGEMKTVPPAVAYAIVHFPRDVGEKYWGFYCRDADLTFDDLGSGKRADMESMSAKLTPKSNVKLFKNLSAYPIDSGI